MEKVNQVRELQPEKKKKAAHPIGQVVKPTQFCIGSKVFATDDYVGVTAETIKKRLAKAGVAVSTAWAKSLYKRINKKGE